MISNIHHICEQGPRALGNRSILADPRRPDMRDVLNAQVKKRYAQWRASFLHGSLQKSTRQPTTHSFAQLSTLQQKQAAPAGDIGPATASLFTLSQVNRKLFAHSTNEAACRRRMNSVPLQSLAPEMHGARV